MLRKTLFSFVLALALTGSNGLCDEIDDFVQTQLDQKQIPGLAYAVIHSGQVIDSRVYGLANLETGAPVRSNSVFEIASLTKPLTALAALALVDSGLVSLDDPVTRFIKEAPAAWSEIQVKHLLSHTGGFAEQLIVSCDGAPAMDVSTRNQFQLIADSPVLFPPGSNAAYSDPGYFLLGMIIESATGLKYSEAMDRLIFETSGMEQSLILDQWRIVEGRVAGYTLRDGHLLNARRDWQHELPSFFGVMATIEDLAQLEIAFERRTLLSDSLAAVMQSPAELADGSPALVFGQPYGMGWFTTDYRGYRVSEHGGFSGTHLMRFPDLDFAVVVLTNLDIRSGSGPHLIARGIAGLADERFLRPDMMPVTPDPDSSRTAVLLKTLHDADSWSENPGLSNGLRARWAAIPKRIREARSDLYRSISELRYVGHDNPGYDGLTRFGETVGRIRYYRGTADRGDIHLTVWTDPEGRTLDISHF